MMEREVLGRYCPDCDITYFSRTRHAFACCICWEDNVDPRKGGYIDGGRDYYRVGGRGVLVHITIQQTEEELEKDWRTKEDKYGRLKGNVGTLLKTTT